MPTDIDHIIVDDNMAYGQLAIQNTILYQKRDQQVYAVPSVMKTGELTSATASCAPVIYEELV